MRLYLPVIVVALSVVQAAAKPALQGIETGMTIGQAEVIVVQKGYTCLKHKSPNGGPNALECRGKGGSEVVEVTPAPISGVVLRVIYIFQSTLGRDAIKAAVEKQFDLIARPPSSSYMAVWTFKDAPGTALGLSHGGDSLTMVDEALANQESQELQRRQREAPPPKF